MPGWDDVFGACPAEVQAIALALRTEVQRQAPGAVETARPGDRAVTFGNGPRKMLDGYLYMMPQTGRVNLGFYQGARLPDPDGLLEGTGKALRHVKVSAPAVTPALKGLIAAAMALHSGRAG